MRVTLIKSRYQALSKSTAQDKTSGLHNRSSSESSISQSFYRKLLSGSGFYKHLVLTTIKECGRL